MTNKQRQIIKSWAKLRHPDKDFLNAAYLLFESLDEHDKEAMLFEFKMYVNDVRAGRIEPSVPQIPIRMIKK